MSFDEIHTSAETAKGLLDAAPAQPAVEGWQHIAGLVENVNEAHQDLVEANERLYAALGYVSSAEAVDNVGAMASMISANGTEARDRMAAASEGSTDIRASNMLHFLAAVIANGDAQQQSAATTRENILDFKSRVSALHFSITGIKDDVEAGRSNATDGVEAVAQAKQGIEDFQESL